MAAVLCISIMPKTEGLAKVKKGNKYGFVDKYGNEIIEPKYEQAGRFVNGKAKVTLLNQTFHIDKKGNSLSSEEV